MLREYTRVHELAGLLSRTSFDKQSFDEYLRQAAVHGVDALLESNSKNGRIARALSRLAGWSLRHELDKAVHQRQGAVASAKRLKHRLAPEVLTQIAERQLAGGIDKAIDAYQRLHNDGMHHPLLTGQSRCMLGCKNKYVPS